MQQLHVTNIEQIQHSTRVVESCDVCDGTGLTPSSLSHMNVAVCSGCNGHGKVVVHEWADANMGEVIRRVRYA